MRPLNISITIVLVSQLWASEMLTWSSLMAAARIVAFEWLCRAFLDFCTARRFERTQAVIATERVNGAIEARCLLAFGLLSSSCLRTSHCERLYYERRTQNWSTSVQQFAPRSELCAYYYSHWNTLTIKCESWLWKLNTLVLYVSIR